MIHSDGTKEWWKNGFRHRDNDMPAIEYLYGSKEYWKNGFKHRDNDEPAVIDFGTFQKILTWYKNGEIFRENNKPNKIKKNIFSNREMEEELEETFTVREWHNEFGLHRLDGPAVESCECDEYWINGQKISKENFLLNKELNESLKHNIQQKKSKI